MALTIKQIEAALTATGGFVSQTAKKLGVKPNAIYERLRKSPYLKQVKAEIEESFLDLAESKLIKKMNDEDLGAICFYLKCKGKSRGYIEKQQMELSGDEKKPVQVKHSTTEQLIKAVDNILMGRQ